MHPQTQTALEAGSISILNHFGEKAQIIKACEELMECAAVLLKRANLARPEPYGDVVDEIADVMVMMHQMRFLFGGSEVDNRVIEKLDRTLEMIRNQNGEQMRLFEEEKNTRRRLNAAIGRAEARAEREKAAAVPCEICHHVGCTMGAR